jgi:RNA polymerase sigma-70 factor (ECF subfamily)
VELDAESFRSLHRAQAPGVWNFACYRLGQDDAEDAAAEVFARAWAVRDSWRPERGAPEAWLWGIARHVVADALRRLPRTAADVPEDLPDAAADPATRLSDVDHALAAVARLADIDQEIIALRFGSGHTNRAIAGLLGLTEANVAQRLRRALRTVRTALTEPERVP